MKNRLLARAIIVTGVLVAATTATPARASAPAPAAGEWREAPAPTTPLTPDGALTQVSCAAPDACVAVGATGNAPTGRRTAFAEVWNGVRWRVSPLPPPPHGGTSTLTDVSCASATACVAVGSTANGEANFRTDTFALSWDGTTWTTLATVDPGGSLPSASLAAVSCVSATACTAVGTGKTGAIAEDWDGTAWTLERLPSPPVGSLVPAAVSCTAPARCVAVGSVRSLPAALVRGETGRTYATLPTVPPDVSAGSLAGVDCPVDGQCLSVGDLHAPAASSPPVPVSYRLADGRWTGVVVPAGPAGHAATADVACASPLECVAVGRVVPDSGSTRPFALRWDGSAWTVDPAAAPRITGLDGLDGVACPVVGVCLAVSDVAGTGLRRALTAPFSERLAGGMWTRLPTPSPLTFPGRRTDDVSCLSATFCVAVGGYDVEDLYDRHAFGAVWDGTGWTTAVLPVPGGATESELTAVSCTSTTRCVAVGSVRNDGAPSAHRGPLWFAAVWDAGSWTTSVLPGQPADDSEYAFAVADVSCAAVDFCVAVGRAGVYGSGYSAIFDGRRWGEGPPSPVEGSGELHAVSCVSAAFCLAVSGGRGAASTVRFDGTVWTPVAPVPAGGGDRPVTLTSVSCATATACTAVGALNYGGRDHGVAQRWDGTGWTVVTDPTLDAGGLDSVSCPPDAGGVCTMVGAVSPDDLHTVPYDVTAGGSWTVDRTAPVMPTEAQVSCSPDLACLVVGFDYFDDVPQHVAVRS